MWRKAIAVAVLVALLKHVIQLYWFLGSYRELRNHKQGECKLIPGIGGGSEDLTVLLDGLAFITSGLRKHAIGRLYVFNFNDADNGVMELNITGNFNKKGFHPHGLTVWEDKESGEVTLFVVNHAPDRDHVEVFRYSRQSPSTVLFVKSITDETFRLTNDLVATGKDTFYLTNYFWWPFPWFFVEVFALFKWGSVVYYDGRAGKVVLSGMSIPNGINISPDKRYLYLSDFGEGKLKVYRRDSDLQLTNIQTVPMYTAIDNIEVDPEKGDLWIAAHLSIWHIFTQEIIDKNTPSQVFRLKTRNGLVEDVSEVYADRGLQLSGSSVAAHYERQMLVGTVGDKLLYCKLQCQCD